MNDRNFSYYLTRYFLVYLPGDRGLSPHTIVSYRDTFKQLLSYMKEIQNIPPQKMMLELFTGQMTREFLNHLEMLGKSVPTRNQRLAAIKAFTNYLIYEDPGHLFQYQQILKIHAKKCAEPAVSYFTIEGAASLLGQPDATTRHGYRDMLLLSLLYDSGARVSEIIQVRIGDIRLAEPHTILLHGKGNKDRIVPLSDKTAQLILNFLKKEKLQAPEYCCRVLFTNPQGKPLTRAGISYILKKYADQVRLANPGLLPEQLTPHCVRHSKAMHLLQAGVPLIYIRDFLGHSQIRTTEIYAKADSDEKRKALANAYPELIADVSENMQSWKEDADLIRWLDDLC